MCDQNKILLLLIIGTNPTTNPGPPLFRSHQLVRVTCASSEICEADDMLFMQHTLREELFALFHIHALTGGYDWLVFLKLTGCPALLANIRWPAILVHILAYNSSSLNTAQCDDRVMMLDQKPFGCARLLTAGQALGGRHGRFQSLCWGVTDHASLLLCL